MKKLLFTLSLLLLPLLASADPVEIDGIYYNFFEETGQAEVTKNPNNYGGNVEIPESVVYEEKNYRVTSIGEMSFYGCSLTSLTIPNSVTSIGANAFNSCGHLTSLTIPNSVTSIGAYAFFWCYSLTSVIIGNSVTSICDGAFSTCGALTSLTIPNSVTSIGSEAFYQCYRLTSVTIPNSVISIGNSAFSGCSGLTSLTIPNSVTNIGDGAFSGCSGLTSINVDNGNSKYDSRNDCNAIIETLSSTLIAGCKNTIIPNSVTSIGNSAFSGCRDLPSVTIHNDVTSIGNYAFSGCSGLTSVTIPNSVTNIGDWAFSDCSGLTSMIIPNSVTSIANGAFSGCSGLTSVNIPNSVTSIGEAAFSGCSGLTSVTIPNSVTSIDQSVFRGCNLHTVISLIENPFQIFGKSDDFTKTFSLYTFEKATLYVPVGTIDKYKATEGWKDFMSIKERDKAETYKLTYIVDSEVINSYDLIYGEAITPEPAPTREGYTFSGWSTIPATMPAHDMTVFGTFTINKYKLTFIVDGEVYMYYDIEYGATITPEDWPTKEGYTFLSLSEIPETMPANDVTVTGTFAVNKYKLIYMVDGEEYKSYDIEYGATITPEAWPTKEGYTFSGWSDIPETMPAHDVVVTGTFIQNEQTTEITIDDVTYDITGEGTVTIVGSDQKGDVEIQSTINVNGQTFYVTAIGYSAFKDNLDMTSLTIPEGVTTIGSYAFEGCLNLTLINIGKDVLKIGSMAFANIGAAAAARTRGESPLVVNCYAEKVPDAEYDAFLYTPVEDGTLLVNDNLVDEYRMTAPWNYFGKIMGFEEAAGINSISIDSANARIYDMQGNRLDNPQKGVNIIRMKDGKTKKIIVK